MITMYITDNVVDLYSGIVCFVVYIMHNIYVQYFMHCCRKYCHFKTPKRRTLMSA